MIKIIITLSIGIAIGAGGLWAFLYSLAPDGK